jgi:hypothetical protein
MPAQVRHVSLHRVANTELRVISDIERGVLPIIETEETVIEAYIHYGVWQHQWVSLFLLQNLEPLAAQLKERGDTPADVGAALGDRPAVTLYDLADLSGCHLFVSERVVRRASYWDDMQAMYGLLAHEHAHPLSENDATRHSRRLRTEVTWEAGDSVQLTETEPKTMTTSVLGLIETLMHRLCINAPRELFANELTIRSGFGQELLHLDRRNLANAASSVRGRNMVQDGLRQQVSHSRLVEGMVESLLLLGDMHSYLDHTFEIAAFYRADSRDEGQELETVLRQDVLADLDAQIATVFTSLLGAYLELVPEMTADEIRQWSNGVASLLVGNLNRRGLPIRCRIDLLG